MKKIMKIGCLGFIGLFVLVVVISIFSEGEDSPITAPVTTENANGQEQQAKDKSNYDNKDQDSRATIGEELQVGDVTFKVNSIEETNEITAGNGVFVYSPDAEGAVFLIVNVTVENKGSEMIQTDSSFFKLITENGVEYSPSTILVADDKFFAFDGINPGLSLSGNVVFEVPSGLTGLDLRVQTGFWGTETGIINLN